jgi:hypothetical protein
MKKLDEIVIEVERLATLIGAFPDTLPTYGMSSDFARPHIEVSDCEYHYVVVERGQERSRVTTVSFDELLFLVFRDVTFHLAVEFELRHRIELQDCRRGIFSHQIQLLSALSSAWAARQAADHVGILATHPFDDFAGYYASRIAGYTQAGLSYGAACCRQPKTSHLNG